MSPDNPPSIHSGILSLAGIHKSYDTGACTVEVLRDLDLHVEAGEMIAIMGKSGSGKSTLMNIIGLLDRADKGRYMLGGREIADLNDRELSEARNALIGFVFQSFFLLPRLNAQENVCLPLMYRGTPEGEQHSRAMEMLEKVEMTDRAEHRPHELSGGQRQRVAIARALVGKPHLVLADEPTGALDPKVGKDILALFGQLNREDGITLVIITHDPGVAASCGRTLVMKDGRLEAASS